MVIYSPPINNAQTYPQNYMYNAGYNSQYSNNIGYNNNTIGSYNNNTTSIFNNNYYQNYAQQTDNKEFIEAYEYFSKHQDEFHSMENLNSGKSTLNDGIFTEDELQKFIDKRS